MEIRKLTIGADPELFIINESTNEVVSAIGIIPGEKGEPYISEDMPKGFGLETDNIVAEFNIPPATSKIEFINNIQYMQNYIDKFVKEINPKLGILCESSMMVDPKELQSDQAKLFGCDVDYNAYTQSANEKPKGELTNLRSCGFHIHIGYENNNIDTSLRIVKFLDTFLGLPSLLYDDDKKRRSLYGKAGCFRLTSYGVEYRTLSSAMMKNTERLEFIWDQLIKALNGINNLCLPPSSLVRKAIDNSDIDLAKKLITDFSIY